MHHHHNRRGRGNPPWVDIVESLSGIGRNFERWSFGPDGFGWDGPPRGGRGRGGHGGRGGRRRMFASGELRLVLLKLIADEPRHGYELMRALEDLTGGNYSPSPGVIYPTLSMLEDEGVIEESRDPKDADSPRKAFAATKAGLDELAEKADEVDALITRLSDLDEREEASNRRPPELLRALMNFGGVLRNRAMEGKLDNAALQEVVDIIDDAAKRIERI